MRSNLLLRSILFLLEKDFHLLNSFREDYYDIFHLYAEFVQYNNNTEIESVSGFKTQNLGFN